MESRGVNEQSKPNLVPVTRIHDLRPDFLEAAQHENFAAPAGYAMVAVNTDGTVSWCWRFGNTGQALIGAVSTLHARLVREALEP